MGDGSNPVFSPSRHDREPHEPNRSIHLFVTLRMGLQFLKEIIHDPLLIV